MNGIFANYLWTMFWGNVFWIFWIVWLFTRKYKYRCIRVYVWFKDDKHVIWMWIWLILKISGCSTEYEACDSFASLTRHQTSYSGSAGWYFRHQSIHIQITYTYLISLGRDYSIKFMLIAVFSVADLSSGIDQA
jgi:hypothetical protein